MVRSPVPISQPASFTARVKRSLLRCRSHNPFQRQSSSLNVKLKLALVCIAAVAGLSLAKPPRFPGLDGRRGPNNNLRARPRRDDAHNNATAPSGGGDGGNSQNDEELLQALRELPLPTSDEELEALNAEFADLDPSLILRWASGSLPESSRLAQVTSFGPSGLVALHLLWRSRLTEDVPVITMDTLHLFPESYEFYETIRSYYEKLEGEGGEGNAMELIVTKPLRVTHPPEMNGEGVIDGVIESRKEFEEIYDPLMWKTDRREFTRVTKIDPLNRALDERQIRMWITGRRRSSGGERADMDVLEFEEVESTMPDRSSTDGKSHNPFEESRGRWKLNPLAYWTHDQVWDYIHDHNLPYNTLYDKGYTSLGDEMTTGLPELKRTAGEGDAFERSGRFVGMGNDKECGLHSHIEKVKKQKQAALDAGEEFTAPVLVCDKCMDLDIHNFEKQVTTGEEGGELLVEFYSPYCGGCQAFAPTLNRIADQLSLDDPLLQVARFDITENEIPKINGEELFKVEFTPTLYRVRRTPELSVHLYEGEDDFKPILRWLTNNTPEMEAKAKRKADMLGRKETKKRRWRVGVRAP